jgi:hypothetical protein
MINGARPNTTYQVVLQVFSDDCDGDLALQIPTATLATNLVANGNGVVTYQTRCTEVEID